MDLRDIEYSIFGPYLVLTDSKEVYSEDGKLLGKLTKNNMTEAQITEYLAKKKGKDDSTS